MKWLVLLTLFLGGCVTTYAPPKNKAQPTIRIDVKNIKRLLFFEEGKDCSQNTALLPPYNPYLNDALPLPVRANQLVAFQLDNTTNRQRCTAMMSFYPRINHDYVIYNKVKFDQRNTLSCRFKIIRKNRLDNASRWQDEETLKFRQPVKALKADARHCR